MYAPTHTTFRFVPYLYVRTCHRSQVPRACAGVRRLHHDTGKRRSTSRSSRCRRYCRRHHTTATTAKREQRGRGRDGRRQRSRGGSCGNRLRVLDLPPARVGRRGTGKRRKLLRLAGFTLILLPEFGAVRGGLSQGVDNSPPGTTFSQIGRRRPTLSENVLMLLCICAREGNSGRQRTGVKDAEKTQLPKTGLAL